MRLPAELVAMPDGVAGITIAVPLPVVVALVEQHAPVPIAVEML